MNKKVKKTRLHTLDMKGDCKGERCFFVWGEGEGVFDKGSKAAADIAGVSESTDWVGDVVFEG